MRALLTLLVRAYQLVLRPVLPRACRYWPTCSDYALEALQVHGAARGSWLAVKRVCRCHPVAFLGGGQGVDPVPPRIDGPHAIAHDAHDAAPPGAST